MPPKRTRAGRAGLSRQQVLDAALSLLDRDGIAALSMRRLGAELGVEAMTLYHYLPNKDALLDGVVERVMAEAETGLAAGPWDRALTDYARSLRATLLRHPGAVLLVATRPAVTPETLRAAERGLALLCAAGFPVGRALDTLNALTTGLCCEEAETGAGRTGITGGMPFTLGFGGALEAEIGRASCRERV